MAEDITFVMHKEWLDSIASLPIEQQDKIIAEIVRYGTNSKLQHSEDSLVTSFVGLLKNRIDFSKTKYSQKIEMAKGAGRKKKIDDEEVLRLAREGKNSAEIAEFLGCSKSAIDHSDGWKRRKAENEETKKMITDWDF